MFVQGIVGQLNDDEGLRSTLTLPPRWDQWKAGDRVTVRGSFTPHRWH